MAGDLNRRETQRRIVGRVLNFVSSAEFETASLVLLKEKERQLRTAFEKFTTEHMNIVEITEPNDLDVQHEALEAAENIYTQARVALAEKIDILERDQEDQEIERNRQREESRHSSFNTAGSEDNEIDNANANRADIDRNANRADIDRNANRAENNFPNREIQLERIKLPMFYGDHAKWSEWRSSYDSLVHRSTTMSSSHKFHMLKARVGGTAERVLSGWIVTGESYQSAYETLVKVYDNKYRITMAHLDELYQIPAYSTETLDGLRDDRHDEPLLSTIGSNWFPCRCMGPYFVLQSNKKNASKIQNSMGNNPRSYRNAKTFRSAELFGKKIKWLRKFGPIFS